MSTRLLLGDVRETLRNVADQSVHCVVTSPPYFGLRSYLPDGVKLRGDLDAETTERVLRELAELGIAPHI